MHAREAVEIVNNLPLRCVENHELIGVHMRDVQPTARWIEGLIVESYC
jgi:hypothetical protein